jgi:phosphoribosylformylglycinamidine synthase
MKARVHVTLKSGVLDPQGAAVRHALGSLGFDGVGEVRMGKVIELDLADPGETQRAEGVAHRLALGVEHAGLQRHLDARFHPGTPQFTSFGPTWVRPFVRGITPSRFATSV